MCNVAAHGSLSSLVKQASSCASVGQPIIQVLLPEPTTSEDSTLTSIRVSNTPPSSSQVQDLAKTDVHKELPPQSEPTQSPDIGIVWAEALKIAKEKLNNDNLPINLTDLTSQLPNGNIRAVIEQLDTLQKAEKDKRRNKIAERLGKFLKTAEPYTVIVDKAAQNSQVAALVWAGVWGIMRVCIHILCHRN